MSQVSLANYSRANECSPMLVAALGSRLTLTQRKSGFRLSTLSLKLGKQLGWFDAQGVRDFLQCHDGDVLFLPLHRADMSAIDIHHRRQSRLRHAAFFAVVFEIPCKNDADVHPRVKSLSRILVRRIIIRI